ncbi:MAG: exopolyphosphatase [Actinobacteria bacterium]|nr:exopolyphosphatase [Actinomycetota bacterium]
MRKSLRLASIDIGTNSTRLLVADCDGERTETLDRRMVITRLGERVDETGLLAPEAVERTLAALEVYRDVMRPLEPARTSAAATSAVRDCTNGPGFLDMAEEVIGERPSVLHGEKEARMSFLGALSDLAGELAEEQAGPVLVFDIGGGSTELIVGSPLPCPSPLEGEGWGGGCEFLITATRSVDVGCVRMSERFLRGDPPSPVGVGRMESHILGRLKPVIDAILPERPSLVIGLAGTVTTVSAIRQGLGEYRTEKIHHSTLSRRDVEEIFTRLASVPVEERKSVMGLEPGRADIIVGGVAVLRAVMDLVGPDEMLVSEKDILDGLVIDLYREIS